MDLPVRLSPTRAELAARCERRHVLTDILEYGKTKAPSAGFGSVIHAASANWWRNADLPLAKRLQQGHWTVDEAYREFMADVEFPGTHTIELAHSMFDGYASLAEMVGPYSAQTPWQEVTIEQRIELPVGGFVLSFQQDRVYYNKELDWLVIVDLKTASRVDARWRAGWYRSLQMKLYRYAALRLYEPTQLDIVIEGLGKAAKPKLEYVVLPAWSQPLLDEAVDQFTLAADRDRALIVQATHDGVVDMEALEALAVTDTSVNYHDCTSYGFECPFLEVCTAEPDERQAILHARYKHIAQDF